MAADKHNTPGGEGPVDETALQLMKEAHQHPRPLSNAEAIEFISRFVWMGFPRPLPSRGRGPKPKRTQYDVASERRKGLYHRLVRLPRSGAAARVKIGDRRRERVKAIADTKRSRVKPHKLAGEILRDLELHGIQCDASTVRRILRQLGRRK